ncbi:hypothetical protein [Wolbachia endosymbiont (group A) of Icerya purchasi]|uniref:hypothetical protein n=1 Tax=Wolbachia endosymbiont (group A) of Icerya purchasi TaxID=2954019 RepID=UPI002232C4B0|nr:hypothetical protein [Wolbachia endosymbiont (group A) of Icerya purchasi]
MAKVKNLSKNQLNKLHKGILAAIGSRTNIEQPMAVNEVKKRYLSPVMDVTRQSTREKDLIMFMAKDL